MFVLLKKIIKRLTWVAVVCILQFGNKKNVAIFCSDWVPAVQCGTWYTDGAHKNQHRGTRQNSRNAGQLGRVP
jgi:hypothetical protein